MSLFQNTYDVIVVGGGHAGCEAAAAAANMGCTTLLVTMNLQNIAQMSCNPAMGALQKDKLLEKLMRLEDIRAWFLIKQPYSLKCLIFRKDLLCGRQDVKAIECVLQKNGG